MQPVDGNANSLWHSAASRSVFGRLTRWCNSPYALWLLIGIGVLRTAILLLTYPPAHGPDSLTYFLYAERLTGQDFPALAQLVPPLYPYLILVTYKWLGSAYWLVALQVVMAVTIAPLYYLSIRRYSPILACLAGLVIVADVQHGIVFNLLSTEPLYAFLLACLIYVLLAAFERQRLHTDRVAWRWFLAVGGIVALLLLTRPVAKFMIVPVALLVWVIVRHWRPAVVTIVGFAGVVAGYALLSLVVVGQVEGLTSGLYMALRPTILQERARLEAGGQAGSPAADCQRGDEDCSTPEGAAEPDAPTGGAALRDLGYIWERVRNILLGEQFGDYLAQVGASTLDFLSLSGQQYGYDPVLPGEVQCVASEARAEGVTPEWFGAFHASWALPSDPETLTALREIVPAVYTAMCPSLPNVPALRSGVDYVAFRYRSLARPEHQLLFWYGGVFLLAVVMPSARRYLPLLLTMAMLLLYHALISAVSLNVQPRYVVVTNPFRAVLLTAMVVLLVRAGAALVERVWGWRSQKAEGRPPEG